MVHVSLEKCIAILDQCKHLGSDVGIKDRNILFEFSRRPVLSTYMIYSMYKGDEISGEPMAYKNTHMHVKNLGFLGFIKQVKWKDTKHGAIYYRITEAGMFQVMLQLPDLNGMILDLPSILDNHGNYLIFETLLYPCFKKETLAAIEWRDRPHIIGRGGRGTRYLAYEITKAILEYLKSCCMNMRDRPSNLDSLIPSLRDVLIMKILLCLSRPQVVKEKDQMNILSLLAQDRRFMNIAQELQKDYNRILDFAIQLRTRS